MRSKVVVMLLAVGLALVGARVAHADGRVVVLEVDGDRARRFEKDLTAMVKKDHKVISRRTFDRAASKAGIEDRDAKSLAAVIDKVEADAVVDATIEKGGGVYTLTIRVRGADGKTAKKLTVDLAKRRLSSKAKRRLGKRLLAAIGEVRTRQDESEVVEIVEADGDDDEGAEVARRPADKDVVKQAEALVPPPEKAAEGDAALATAAAAPKDPAAPKDAGAPTRVAATEVGADGSGLDGENPLPGKRSTATASVSATAFRPRPARPMAMRLEAGGLATIRNLDFQTRADFREAPAGYQGPPTPGVHVAAELYPLAFRTSGFFSGLGLAGEYNRSLLLTTRSADAMEVALPTTQAQWSIGARFRIRFGSRVTSPSLTLGAGYGQRSFEVDRSGLPTAAKLDLPDVTYQYIDPGLTFRLPIGSRVALSAGGRALLLLDAGAIQNPEEYGGATTTGGEANLGLDVYLGRFLVTVQGYGALVFLDFQGNGEQISNRDGDAATEDVAGATDRYLGGSASLGVTF